MLVRLDSEPGTSNPRMTQLTTQVSRELREHPRRRQRRRARGTRDRVGPGRGRQLERGLGQHRLRRRLRRDDRVHRGHRGPRAQRARTTSSPTRRRRSRTSARCSEGENPVTGDGLDVLTGSDKPLAVRVFGQDQDVLRRQAARVQQLVARRRRRREPARSSCRRASPNLEIEVDLAKARAQGIKPGDVRRAEASAAAGHRGRQRVRGPEGLRGDRQGHARDAPQRGERSQPADRQARRRSRPARRRRRRARRARRRP